MSIETQARPSVESERKVIHGVGLVVVHEGTGDIWVNRDRNSRGATGRRMGQNTIPFETSKVGELATQTVLGGLVEVFDDTDNQGKPFMPILAERLHRMTTVPTPTFLVPQENNSILCDIHVLVYDGPTALNVMPYDSAEAEHVGWMSHEAFLDSDVRSLARITVGDSRTTDAIEQTIHAYQSKPANRSRIIPTGFSLREFYAQREQRQDAIRPVVIYQSKGRQ